MINCSLCPLGIGQEVIGLICSKKDVEIGAGKSFMSVWIVKNENSFLREVVVPSSQKVLRADETETHQILSMLFYYRGMVCLNSRCLVPTSFRVPWKAGFSPHWWLWWESGEAGPGWSTPSANAPAASSMPLMRSSFTVRVPKRPEATCVFGSVTLASSTVSLSIFADNKQAEGWPNFLHPCN